MEHKDPSTIRAELAAPFAPEDLEWRLQRVYETDLRGIAVPYITNRAIQNRLDEVVGVDGWYNDFKPWHSDGKKQSQLCGIAIYFEGKGFLTKWDGAEDSDIESVKGGLSDSMKRAAVQWGIGRILYKMDTVYVDVEPKGKTFVMKKGQRDKLDRVYLEALRKLGQTLPASGKVPPATGPKPAPAPKQIAAPKTAQTTPTPVAYEYIVRTAKIQKGMNSTSTQLTLEAADGTRRNAFAPGAHPGLVPGAMLVKVKLTRKTQDTVVFYVLESYEFADPQQRAA